MVVELSLDMVVELSLDMVVELSWEFSIVEKLFRFHLIFQDFNDVHLFTKSKITSLKFSRRSPLPYRQVVARHAYPVRFCLHKDQIFALAEQ